MSKLTIGVLIKEAAEAHKVGDYIKEKNLIKSSMIYMNVSQEKKICLH